MSNFSKALVVESAYHNISQAALEGVIGVFNSFSPLLPELNNSKLPKTYRGLKGKANLALPPVYIIGCFLHKTTEEVILTEPSKRLPRKNKSQYKLLFEYSYVDVCLYKLICVNIFLKFCFSGQGYHRLPHISSQRLWRV